MVITEPQRAALLCGGVANPVARILRCVNGVGRILAHAADRIAAGAEGQHDAKSSRDLRGDGGGHVTILFVEPVTQRMDRQLVAFHRRSRTLAALWLLAHPRRRFPLVGIFQIRLHDEGIGMLSCRFPERLEVRHVITLDLVAAMIDLVLRLRPMLFMTSLRSAFALPDGMGAVADIFFTV
jgi:hypothetical protein